MKNKNIAAASCLAALAVALGYAERLVPVPLFVHGIKLGLSNAAVLIALCRLNEKYAFAVAVIKVTVVCLLFAGFQSFIYSFSGGMLSVLAMTLAKKTKLFSAVGISVVGGIFHNAGQLAAAAFVLGTASVFYYLPALLIGGATCGALLGILCNIVLKHLEKI